MKAPHVVAVVEEELLHVVVAVDEEKSLHVVATEESGRRPRRGRRRRGRWEEESEETGQRQPRRWRRRMGSVGRKQNGSVRERTWSPGSLAR